MTHPKNGRNILELIHRTYPNGQKQKFKETRITMRYQFLNLLLANSKKDTMLFHYWWKHELLWPFLKAPCIIYSTVLLGILQEPAHNVCTSKVLETKWMSLDRGLLCLPREVDPIPLVWGAEGALYYQVSNTVQMSILNLIPHLIVAGEKYTSK